MPALQLFSPFVVPKIRYIRKSPFSCKPTNLSSTTTNTNPRSFLSRMSSSSAPSSSSLAALAPLEAILFDIDGTLCDSDAIHYHAFVGMLQEVGFNGGEPITEEFYSKNLSGMDNDELCPVLFPDWDLERAKKFLDDKEAMFRRIAKDELKPNPGLDKLCKWVKDQGLRRAAVTNAPRANAELMISLVGLGDFFELLIVGSECERPKPYPDPYLKGLQGLGVSAEHTFIFEDSTSGTKAGVAAGMPVVCIAVRNPEKMLLEAGATMVIKDYNDPKLWAALKELEKKTEEVKVVA